MQWYKYALFALGVGLICDGVGSIFYYWNDIGPDGKRQGIKDHSVRIARAAGGAFCILLAGVVLP